MYNRYIPAHSRYEAAVPPPPSPPRQTGAASVGGGFKKLLGGLLGAGQAEGVGQTDAGQALRGLLRRFHLDDLDFGDILLALIVLLLILEDGDDLDLIITLGLMILFSLGEK